ncbi:MAG: proline dehydrogenase family protein [Bryobacteraceae bacterium]|nr:proline dehydrogenase family protein [Bryobacteraceae bacterium]
MLRSALLYLSRQPSLRRWAETSKFAAPLTHRFVAGNTLAEAIAVCRKVNREGVAVSLDHLGENVSTAAEAAQSRETCLQAIAKISDERLNSTVSIKLTQFGLDLGDAICRDNVAPVVERAKAAGTRVEFDMESSGYVDRTLAIVAAMHERYGCVRAVIQAYLYRSEKDIERLSAAGIPVRLCKGAYKEPPEVAFERKADVDANYLKLAKALLERGVDPALATHDDRMVRAGDGHASDRFEFQMLYGVRRDLQRSMVEQGRRLRLYVPYGEAWYPYFMRRLAERPANVLFLAKSVLRN